LTTLQDWTVIIVEDTYDDIQLASAILTYHGAAIKVVNNGQECLQLLTQLEPTLILTDLSMPQMDGWEMLRRIRAADLTRHIPVVAVTAYDSVDVAHDATQAGFDAYFAKPLSPRTIVQQLVDIVN